MSLPVSFMGAVVGFVIGTQLRGSVFGQTSSAGYHRTNGQFVGKSSASMNQILFIGATTVIGSIGGPPVWDAVVANPVVGGIGVFVAAYVGLHMTIDSWNLF